MLSFGKTLLNPSYLKLTSCTVLMGNMSSHPSIIVYPLHHQSGDLNRKSADYSHFTMLFIYEFKCCQNTICLNRGGWD